VAAPPEVKTCKTASRRATVERGSSATFPDCNLPYPGLTHTDNTRDKWQRTGGCGLDLDGATREEGRELQE
jgi:hypothetical protein